MRAGKYLLLVVLTGVCTVLAACGQPPAAVSPGGPGLSRGDVDRQEAATRWANDYCIAVGSLVDGLAAMPTVDPSTPQRAVRTSSELLGSVINGLDQAVQGLDALPPSPVPGGDGVRADALRSFTTVRANAVAAKTQLDSVSNNSRIDQQTLGAARGPLDEVSRLDLLAGFDTYPELAAARLRAPVCGQLTAHATPESTTAASPQSGTGGN
ncbi:hypothetical protein [Amycolatopsis taiwanensis]|uniref:Lipoprotein n=1 Tax=Amycolatopsis taiwanensis TaxID=342230 RepID=A0A9W6R324_9PSEU|nr:hypothetical protein [Amycolatopsis taiwanensis]GLY68606.1 hypothetical protein Atai01_52250 [Amycolatopsis taiwanensis]